MMSGEIKKIDSIRNMAVFQDFCWYSTVRDQGNNIAEFKRINILYGRNYSGKTTLSRVFRALETGSISDKYDSPRFQLSLDDGSSITHDSLEGHGQVVRVFNEDFVKVNLQFIDDEEQTIKSFAILGEDNAILEEEIARLEAELGSEEDRSSLFGKLFDAEKRFKEAERTYKERLKALENKLHDKANGPSTGIKHNRTFGDANYNVPKLMNDIATVIDGSYARLSEERLEVHHRILKEEPKEEIRELASLDLKYSALISEAEKLVEKKIQVSEPIQELLNESALTAWVRTGREHHDGKRDTCAFCGGDLPADLWDKLDRHFNRESEELRSTIDGELASIEDEVNRVPKLMKIDSSNFYSKFAVDLNDLKNQFEIQSAACCHALESLAEQLRARKSEIFSSLSFEKPPFEEGKLASVRESYEVLRKESNRYAESLRDDQSKARLALRQHEVFKFVNDTNYAEERQAIEALGEAMNVEKVRRDSSHTKVESKHAEISELKVLLKDERKGAARVNDYLNSFFGHQYLSLQAVEEAPGDESCGYRFVVTRTGKRAFHLSTGECSLIAFCYFMAKLEDIETKGHQPIIWIDDPISSLDSNHIFFVYSLINAKIVALEESEEGMENKISDRFKQLFISTHNLDFLKYLKRLPGALNKRMSEYFIIHRADRSSDIALMPRYLKDYVTEFNFLFHQIYKCANAEIESDDNYVSYYNFGNNARKFLEAFLYFRYPNAEDKDGDKLKRFFGNDRSAASLTDRVSNEFSHLAGILERGVSPIDVPEMKTVAKFILQKIRDRDPDQYSALLQSIGEGAGPFEKEDLRDIEVQ